MTGAAQAGGEPVYLLEENHDLPLCRLQVTVRTGAGTDVREGATTGAGAPLGRANFATELMLRGAGGRTRTSIDEAIDTLGGSLSVYCDHDAVTFQILALKQKLPQATEILADVLLRPDFPQDEADRLRREIAAGLDDLRDDDSSLAWRFFARALYGDHHYGRPVAGVAESLPLLDVAGARAWHAAQVRRGNLIFGAAGDITPVELEHLLQTHFGEVPAGARQDRPVPEPVAQGGMRVVLVDKPERTQSQILIGQLAPRWGEPLYLPLYVAATAFGGTFTARLMDEVRVKRGLSYGASARVGSGRGRLGVVVHVFPSAAQTKETLELVLRLYREWAAGLRPEEIDFAKSYLGKSYAFNIQTAEGRLGIRTKLLLCDMPPEFMRNFPQRVGAVTYGQVQEALTWLRPSDLLVTLVGTAETLREQVMSVPALAGAALDVPRYDSY